MTKRIEVTRAFYLDGVVQEVGRKIEVSRVLAAELIHNNKAVLAAEKPAKASKPKESNDEPV